MVPEGGAPPELMAMLGGGAPPQQQGPPAPADGQELLRQAIQVVRQYIESEQDDEDKLAGEKVTSLLQQILAKQAKEQDDLLQGKMSPRGLRQALA